MARKYKRRLPEGPFYRDLGRTIRTTRSAAGKSQEEVAEHLDLSFQQVQKYEKGTNRIPVDRLVSLSAYLDVPLTHFVRQDSTSGNDSAIRALIEDLSDSQSRALLKSWTAIKDRHVRAAILDLVKSMAAVSP